MDQLFEIFAVKLRNVPKGFSRFLLQNIHWEHRLISILGARGTGKTTLLLQHIKQQFGGPSKDLLYVDVSHLYFSTHTLLELADEFYKKGGKYLFLDEIHKYRNWSTEIKQIYDTYSSLYIVFTGSSILEIDKGEADLSRRLVRYFLPEMSLREYYCLTSGNQIKPIGLEAILKNHLEIAFEMASKFRPMEIMGKFLKFGSYPYTIEGEEVYYEKLRNTINQILETDLPLSESIDFNSIIKIKKLLAILAASVPFKPNTHKIAELTEVSRPTLLKLFSLLDRAQLIHMLESDTKGIRKMGKPEKIYLHNTNILNALAPTNTDKGQLRETFFIQHLSQAHSIEIPEYGDFVVDGKYIFEIGGRKKGFKQLAGFEEAFVVADDIETGFDKKIPLWLFGFLY